MKALFFVLVLVSGCTAPPSPARTLATLSPGEARPITRTSCPESHPIKGNDNDKGEHIYHLPGQAYYDATHPERCFATEDAAQAAGYRKAWV